MPAPKASSTDRIDLIIILRELPDPRLERTRLHKFEAILVIAICSLLCGAQTFEGMELFGDSKEPWLRTFLELPNGIPSHDTFNRLFAALDPQCFLDAFMRWPQSLRTALADEIDSLRSAVAIDGKAPQTKKSPPTSTPPSPAKTPHWPTANTSKKDTGASKHGATGRAPTSAGLPTAENGKDCAA